jgi:hypothetical protein
MFHLLIGHLHTINLLMIEFLFNRESLDFLKTLFEKSLELTLKGGCTIDIQSYKKAKFNIMASL